MLNRIKNVFSKKTCNIAFENIMNFCNEKFSREINEYIYNTRQAKIEIDKNIDKMKETSKKMRNVTQNAYSNSIRDKFCDKLENTNTIEINDATSVKKYINYINSYIESINSASIKEIIHLYSFKIFMDEITKNIKLINENLKKIDLSSLEKIEKIERKHNEIKSKSSEIEGIKNWILTNDNKIERINMTIEENDINKIKNSVDYKNLLFYRIDLEKNKKDLERINSTLIERISGFDRILKKYAHDNIISKSETKLIDIYIKNTIEIYDNFEEFLNMLLKIKTDDKKSNSIKEIIENKELLIHLYEKRTELMENNQKSESKINQLKTVEALILEKEELIKNSNITIKKLKDENVLLNKRIDDSKLAVQDKIKELEAEISRMIDSSVTITYIY